MNDANPEDGKSRRPLTFSSRAPLHRTEPDEQAHHDKAMLQEQRDRLELFWDDSLHNLQHYLQ